MTFLKATALVGAVCIAIFLGYKYVTADPPGYCAAQGRHISDEEFIKTSEALFAWGMQEKFKAQTRWTSKNPGYPQTQSPGYVNSTPESFERWLADKVANRKRPGFIKVDRSETRTIFRWLFGYQQIQVVMNANSGDGQSPYTYDVCGNVLETGLHSPSAVTTRNYLEILNKYSHDK